ncbi:MAG: hypothetical protein IKB94_00880 [Clostridia bacterium]|nr:hypothetical protein [Clostridia bacterium]
MKKASFALSTIIFMLCCLYHSVFCAFNGIDAVRDLLYRPYKSGLLLINESSIAALFYVSLLCVCTLIAITVLTKADPLALVLWSAVGLLVIVMFTVSFAESLFSVIAFLFLAEIGYAGFVLAKKLKSIE